MPSKDKTIKVNPNDWHCASERDSEVIRLTREWPVERMSKSAYADVSAVIQLLDRLRRLGLPPGPRPVSWRCLRPAKSAYPMTAPASPPGGLAGAVTRGDQEAVGLIAIVSFFAFSGSGIVTSTTPSCVCAVIFVASTPAGSAIERRKDPYRRSRRT